MIHFYVSCKAPIIIFPQLNNENVFYASLGQIIITNSINMVRVARTIELTVKDLKGKMVEQILVSAKGLRASVATLPKEEDWRFCKLSNFQVPTCPYPR